MKSASLAMTVAAAAVFAAAHAEAASIYTYSAASTAENGSGVTGTADFTLNGNL